MNRRLGTVAMIAVVWLVLAAGSAIAAAEPTAAELLERARQGKSVVDADTSRRSATGWDWSLGVGANQLAPLFELTFFDGQDQRFGGYSGLGFRTYSWGTAGATVTSNHFGVVWRMDRNWQGGAGLEWNRADVVARRSGGGASASASEWSPHGWIEAGMERGLAFRVQLSTQSPAASLHWRF